ncbi:SDR family NAD(P)-dependent oxidoreductase [Amycolatopsis endophytica]|uniref:NADP-dependent 3-hydroxy acid dehydrogenase YdfG n=1 Tax=Amycolatopsis endophytica TaxID=860233 RepID=A0A853B7K7_9PSEU|nr:SDR family NAD(P)-dependent oxidoreductase [Amycolatopsis endophytica]NYI90734.1 NADP-dependent 3-hydroxy acid dehydrogenase YdfG [Amycolatopsis endophytica]
MNQPPVAVAATVSAEAFRLTGTAALITGASSGIGAATARRLASQGAAVALVARRTGRLEALAGDITRLGGHALVVTADVADEDQVRRAVERTVERFGRLDIAVANAGVMLLGPLDGADTAEWRRMIELNTLGTMYTARAAVPHLRAAAGTGPRHVADLVLMSSTAGRQVRETNGVYSAGKHAVGAFGEALRRELTAEHIRTALLEPGAVDTELPWHNRPEVQEAMRERFARMRRLHADDVARTVEYIVTRPRHVAVNELLVRPTEQQI